MPPAGTQKLRVRAQPLSRRADFKHIYERGKRQRGKHLTVVVAPRAGRTFRSDPPASDPGGTPYAVRAAYVVSKKVAKQAVRRNRVRRRLREALRNLMRERGLIEDRDIILIAAPSAAEATYANLYNEMAGLLERAKVWAPAVAPSPPGRGVGSEGQVPGGEGP